MKTDYSNFMTKLGLYTKSSISKIESYCMIIRSSDRRKSRNINWIVKYFQVGK